MLLDNCGGKEKDQMIEGFLDKPIADCQLALSSDSATKVLSIFSAGCVVHLWVYFRQEHKILLNRSPH
jgi:hypothetical protein